jgi:hypothetical protein
VKAPDNVDPEEANPGYSRLADAAFALTVPSGPGMIYAAVRGKGNPYMRARLKAGDRGKGIGDIGDGEVIAIYLSAANAYRFINIPAGAGPVAVDLELATGVSREGRLTDPDGKPVTGAQCIGLTDTWDTAMDLDADTFEATGLDPEHPRLLCFAHEGRRLVGSVTLKGRSGGGNGPLVVQLGPACSIKGRLVEEDGTPAADATLECWTFDRAGRGGGTTDGEVFLASGPLSLWPDNRTFSTDSEGRFEVFGLKPGVKTRIQVNSNTKAYVLPLDAGRVLNGIVPKRFGEARALGDVTVKATVRP